MSDEEREPDEIDEAGVDEDGPVIALEFWDEEGKLVVAHFTPDGEVDTRVAEGTTSSDLNEIKNNARAQVSVVVNPDIGSYRRIGEIESHDTSIDSLVFEFMSEPVKTYHELLEMVREHERVTGHAVCKTKPDKRTLN